MTLQEQRIKSWQPEGVLLEGDAIRAVKERCHTLVVAGPGAGKTELLAQRACFLLQTGLCPAPFRILAISFKREAAENLRKRVILRCGKELASRFDSMTFDAFAKDLLDRFRSALAEQSRPSADYEILVGADGSERSIHQRFLELSDQWCGLSNAERRSVGPDALVRTGMLSRPLPWQNWQTDTTFVAAQCMWNALIHHVPSQLTFGMVSRLAEFIVRSNLAIRRAIQQTYKFVFLDEFQDTTSIQFQLTEACFYGGSTVLTAVGDNKQRIMTWAGALPGIFGRFKTLFGAQQINLTQNHRSRTQLVKIQSHFAKELDPQAVEAVVPNPEGSQGECRVFEFVDEVHEAEYLADFIKRSVCDENIPAEEICVLCRAKPDTFAQVLVGKLKELGVPVRIDTGVRDLISEPAAAFILSMISLIFGDTEPEAWDYVNTVVADTLGERHDRGELERMRSVVGFVRKMRARMPEKNAEVDGLVEVFNEYFDFIGKDNFALIYPQYAQGSFLDEVILRLSEAIVPELHAGGWKPLVRTMRGIGSVSVMTMHKSKGLEFHTVIFLGLEDASLWGYQRNAEEETCGLFVALSRAKERCVFTFASSRLGRYQTAEAQSREKIGRIFEIFEIAGVSVERISR